MTPRPVPGAACPPRAPYPTCAPSLLPAPLCLPIMSWTQRSRPRPPSGTERVLTSSRPTRRHTSSSTIAGSWRPKPSASASTRPARGGTAGDSRPVSAARAACAGHPVGRPAAGGSGGAERLFLPLTDSKPAISACALLRLFTPVCSRRGKPGGQEERRSPAPPASIMAWTAAPVCMWSQNRVSTLRRQRRWWGPARWPGAA